MTQQGRPSPEALRAAEVPIRGYIRTPNEAVWAAHAPALGVKRSVCLENVVEALRHGHLDLGTTGANWPQAATFIEREFGGGS